MRTLGAPALLADQTLVTWNAERSLVENLTTAEGMLALTRELADLDAGGEPVAVAGEGLNEMNMRYQSFSQAHLALSYHTNHEHFDQLVPVPVNAFLFGELCRSMGYYNILGDTPESEKRMAVHESLGAIPSLQIRSKDDLHDMSPATQRVLDRARS